MKPFYLLQLLFRWLPLFLLSFQLNAQLIEIETFAELQQEVDAYWVEGSSDKLHPPGSEFVWQLPMMTTAATFPQSFLDDLSSIEEGGVTLYLLQITESDAVPITRNWTDLDGNLATTTTSPPGYNPYQWVLTTFPPPSYLTSSQLDDYVEDRHPNRKTFRLKLIRTVDFPTWEQAMINLATEKEIPIDPANLSVGSLLVDPDQQGMELLTEIPVGVERVGLYTTDNLLGPIQWTQEDAVDILSNPQWIHGHLDGSIKFFLVGNHSLDTDLDGLMDVYEKLISHTSSTSSDTDGDGIDDRDEIYIYETDAMNADSDGDGLKDGWEVEFGYNPNSGDTDNDGRTDDLEDEDGDGLNTKMELARGTRPNGEGSNDSDDDGVNDFDDAVGYDAYFTFPAEPENAYMVVELGVNNASVKAVNNQGTLVIENQGSLYLLEVGSEPVEIGEGTLVDLNNQDQVLYANEAGFQLYEKGESPLDFENEVEEIINSQDPIDPEGSGFSLHETELEWTTFTALSLDDNGNIWYQQTNGRSSEETAYETLDGEILGVLWNDAYLGESWTLFHGDQTLPGSAGTSVTVGEWGSWIVYGNGYEFAWHHPLTDAHLLQLDSISDNVPTADGPIKRFIYGNNRGDWGLSETLEQLESGLLIVEANPLDEPGEEIYPVYTFSDNTSVEVGHLNQDRLSALGTARLPDDERLWKIWQKDGLNVLTPDDPELGQSLYNGGTNEVAVVISQLAENGLMRSGSKLWRNGRILSDEELLGPDLEWGEVQVQAISDNGQFLAGTARKVTVLPNGEKELSTEQYTILLTYAEIVSDYNRDGIINHKDRNRVNATNPWHWWINDDNDVRGEDRGYKGNIRDIPGQPETERDCHDLEIDGIRDLIDFFPLYFDLKQMLLVFPSADFSYHLRHEDNALKFHQDAGAVLDDSDPQLSLRSHFESVLIGWLIGDVWVEKVTAEGIPFPPLVLASSIQGKGVLYLEGVVKTEKPLVVEIRRKSDNELMTKLEFPLNIVDVEDMFRQVNLRSLTGGSGGNPTQINEPPKYPDSLTNNKYLVYVHGYNVSGESARGSQSNLFKRFHQLGSKARFVAVSWFGDPENPTPQIEQLPADYHRAVKNGLITGSILKENLSFMGDLPVTIMAHSLGNAVASQAIANDGFHVDQYVIINGAIALEAYDAEQIDYTGGQDDMARNMTEDDWKPFYDYGEGMEKGKQQRLFAANWYQLFENEVPVDYRSKLTWKNLFAKPQLLSVAYNFYSPGDEVVENANETEEFGDWDNLWDVAKGRHAWVQQEIGKGAQNPLFNLSFYDANGGWKFNDGEDGYRKPKSPIGHRPFTPEEAANEISDEDLKTKPFHSPLYFADIYDPQLGSQRVENFYDRSFMLASGIPAQSYAIAVNACDIFAPEGQPSRNFNMQTEFRTEQAIFAWPVKFPLNPTDWLHNDFRNVAFPFVYQMYQKIIDLAELNQD